MIHSCFQTCPPWLIYFFMQLKHNNLRLEINPFKWEIPLWSLSQVLVDVWHSTTECWGGFPRVRKQRPTDPYAHINRRYFISLFLACRYVITWPKLGPSDVNFTSLCVQGVHRLFTVVVTKLRFRQHCWKLLWWCQGRHPKYPCLWHHLCV